MEQNIKLRPESFREQFRKKDLSKLGFRKHYGYKFIKEDKERPNSGWMLLKDDTSAVIKKLAYTDSERVVYYKESRDLKNLLDLKDAVDKVKELFIQTYN